MSFRNFFSTLLVFVFGAQVATAQVNTATISGTLRDESGAVLPGAAVTVQNQDTGISRSLTTNETGRYTAPALGLGNYQVSVQLPGFQSQVRSGIALTVGREPVVDFTLAVGAVTQTVEVKGEAPLVELTNCQEVRILSGVSRNQPVSNARRPHNSSLCMNCAGSQKKGGLRAALVLVRILTSYGK